MNNEENAKLVSRLLALLAAWFEGDNKRVVGSGDVYISAWPNTLGISLKVTSSRQATRPLPELIRERAYAGLCPARCRWER